MIFRSVLFPPSRLSQAEVLEMAEQIDNGLVQLAFARGLKFFQLNPSWYGFDPIHIRPSLWRPAWQEILDAHLGENEESGGVLEGIQLYLMAPERRQMFGVEQFTPQTGVTLPMGGRIWLF